MKKLSLIILAICILTIEAISQNGTQTIRGVVTENVTGLPLPTAIITIKGAKTLMAYSNADGSYEIKNVPIGRCTVEVSFFGYIPSVVPNVMVLAGKETVVNFALDEKVTQLEDVKVSANKPKDQALNEMAMVSARAFTVEETERFAGSLGDPARMVSNYAGVSSGGNGRNDIVIRGNSPIGLQWRLENIEVPNPNHFAAQGTTGGPVSMINGNLLANSDFMTGAFPAEYSNALSGVFDLNLRSGNNTKYEYVAQVGFNGFEFGAEGPVKLGKNQPKGSIVADFRYSTLQVMDKLGFDLGTGSAVPEYKDFTFLADLPTSRIGRFKIIGLMGNSNIALGRSFEIEEDNSYSATGYSTIFGSGLSVFGVTHTFMPNEKSRIKTAISYQQSNSKTDIDSINYDNQQYNSYYRGDNQEYKWTASTQWRRKFSAKDNMTVGVSVDRYEVSFEDSVKDTDINRFRLLTDVTGILFQTKSYVQWQHKFTDDLTATGGVNYSYLDLTKENIFEGRLGLRWQIVSAFAVNAGVGQHSQMQPHTTYFSKAYNETNNTYTENNRNLKATQAEHYVLGCDWRLLTNLRLKVEGYYQNLHNVPVTQVQPQYSMLNAGADFYIPAFDSLQNSGTGYNKGLEITLEKFLSSGYYFLVTASLYDSKYKGYDGIERNTSFNGQHMLNVLGGYEFKLSKKHYLTFDVKTTWAGGNYRTPIDLEASRASGQEEYDWSQCNSQKNPDYFRTDFRIGFKQNGKKITQEMALDLQNVFNTQNEFAKQYNPRTGEIFTVYQQGFMPMMLYRINF